MLPLCDVIPSRTTPYATIGLILVNTIVFASVLLLDASDPHPPLLLTASPAAGLEWTRLLAGAFVHDSWIHFGVNMLSLWIFGDNIEDAMGRGAFVLFYVSAAAAAAVLAHAALQPAAPLAPVGATGAVAAVMAAYFVLYPRSRVLVAIAPGRPVDLLEVPAVYLPVAWIVLLIATGAAPLAPESAGPLALTAPAAGFAAGAPVGFVLRRRRRWEQDP